MTAIFDPNKINRLLVVMPTWVGDAAMASPTLLELPKLFPNAHITALAKPASAPVIQHLPPIDHIITTKPDEDRSIRGMLRIARELKNQNFDAAVILPNSFRSAMLVRLAGIPNRIGIVRDGRSWLLTIKIPDAKSGEYDGPEPTIKHYLRIPKYLGSQNPCTTMKLATHPDDDAHGEKILLDAGLDPNDTRPIVIINPGANYGDAKIWPADRFAQVATRCANELNMIPVITGAPKERPIIDAVIKAAQTKILDLPAHGLDIHSLKAIVKRAALMITNDTGPRHIAAAFKTPLVTIYGPTDPKLTTIDFPMEREVRVNVPCSPCQKKTCPLTGSKDELCCMMLLTADMVFQAVSDLTNTAGETNA